jgi:hypothetical protein
MPTELIFPILMTILKMLGFTAAVLVGYFVFRLARLKITTRDAIYCEFLEPTKIQTVEILVPRIKDAVPVLHSKRDGFDYFIDVNKQEYTFYPQGTSPWMQEKLPLQQFVRGDAVPRAIREDQLGHQSIPAAVLNNVRNQEFLKASAEVIDQYNKGGQMDKALKKLSTVLMLIMLGGGGGLLVILYLVWNMSQQLSKLAGG